MTDMTATINALQQINTTLNRIAQALTTDQVAFASYAVTSLPVTAATGLGAWATNGRANSGEGSGAGTGTLVIFNGTAWIAQWSGVAVAA